MQIHNIKREHPNRKERRVGRGGVHGKTAGRGTKGQKARAGHRIRPEIRDIIKKLPKKRGYGKNRAKSVVLAALPVAVVKLSSLDKHFSAGDSVNAAALLEKGLIAARKGKVPPIKILATGDVTKKFALSGLAISASAKQKIEKAGGTVA